MTLSLPRRLRSTRSLLAAIALLSALLVQSGELGTSDTMHRLQTAHSFWTSQPQVFPSEYPEFGLVGRGGRLYSWYGMGQSLLMLPADIAGTVIERLPVFADYNGHDPSVRDIFVSFTTNGLIAVLTALLAYRLLGQFGFDERQAVAGVLALFFATTHLHYTQNMSENNCILLLTLAGLSFQYEWLRTGSRRALAIGSAALGLNLLTRLTTALDLLACAVFLLLVSLLEAAGAAKASEPNLLQEPVGAGLAAEKLSSPHQANRTNAASPAWASLPAFAAMLPARHRAVLRRATEYARTALPIYAIFLLIDRIYQFYRFGSFFNTYLTVFGVQQRQLNPSLPAAYPFEGKFLDGFLGPLFAPEKSIFLFDPLLVLALIATVLLWRRLATAVQAFSISAWLLLFGYICFYATYTVWSGDFAWGDRYVSTAAQLATLLALPIVLRHLRSQRSGSMDRWLRLAAYALVAASVAIQLASLAFWLPLEIYQMETLGHPTFVVALRFENIAAFALGKRQAWGLSNVPMTQDPWDYVHITTWNFLPFLLRRVGAAPRLVVDSLMAAWAAGLATLAWLFWELRNSLRRTA